MTPETLRLLLDADDTTAFEEPLTYVFAEEPPEDRVEALRPLLESIAGEPFILWGDRYGAAFAEASLFRPSPPHYWQDVALGLRFSKFGDLFTAREWWQGEPRPLPAEVVRRLIAAVESAGFRYVDRPSLDEPYTGQHPEFQRFSWAFRLFDIPGWPL